MKFNYLTTKLPFLAILGVLFSLASCGAYQYSGHDNDGIYGPDNRRVEYEVEKEAETVVVSDANKNYYKDYFSEKTKEYDMILGDEEIFTDIDSYKGEYDEEYIDTLLIDTLQYKNGYAGWGENTTDININIHNHGWNNWYWRPWRSWRPYWNYGWGWNDPWGWNAGFGWGWNDPWLWNGGFGYSAFWSPWAYPYYGYGYYGHPFYNNYYGHPFYGRRGIAYNRSRRGTLLNSDFNRLSNRRSNALVNPRSLNTPRTVTPRRSFDYNNPRSNSPRSTTQPRTNTPRPRVTTPGNTPRPRTNNPRPRTRPKTTPRSSTPRPKASTPRSSSPRTYTPRSSSPRRSGSMSSGSSSPSRSSGSRSSSSSRGGRRG